MIRLKHLSILFAYTSFIGALFYSSIIHSEPESPQVMVDIYDPPFPFEALDKFYLVYELYLTNLDKDDISLEALEIHDKTTRLPLVGFDKESLKKIMYAPNANGKEEQNTVISPGSFKFVYLTIPFNSFNDMPKEIFHHLNFSKLRGEDKIQQDMETLTLSVNKPFQVMIKPPVRGDFWVAANGPSSTSINRRTNVVINGQNYFPQRYSIDFIQVDLDGKSYQKDEHDNNSYYSYGKEVYAVARGTVVAMKDGIPDNTPHSDKTANNDLDTMNGNYILLEIGKGVYAFYGHLLPGSLKVKLNDKISEGQEIAKIGNSGNSTEPKLHFRVVDRPSYLAGNSLPYTFTEFWVRPSEASQKDHMPEVTFKEAPNGLKRYSNQLMLENMVVKFNDEQKNNIDVNEEQDLNVPKPQTFSHQEPILITEPNPN